MSKVMWQVDHEALDRARASLKLEHPITVQLKDTREFRGQYDHTPLHTITLSRYHLVTPDTASNTLWHELIHAYQFERDYSCDTTHPKYQKRVDAYHTMYAIEPEMHTPEWYDWVTEYFRMPSELEAESLAVYYSPRLPLVIPV